MVLGSHTPAGLGVGQPLLFTHPHSALDRANGTLLMSTTGGARWAPLLTYQHGCHSYSQIVQFQDGKLGIVFDKLLLSLVELAVILMDFRRHWIRDAVVDLIC